MKFSNMDSQINLTLKREYAEMILNFLSNEIQAKGKLGATSLLEMIESFEVALNRDMTQELANLNTEEE